MRDWDTLFDALKADGWTIKRTRRGHYKCISPRGEVVFCSGSEAHSRGLRNAIQWLKRFGFQQ